MSRKDNYSPSTHMKSRGHSTTATIRFDVGDLVFLKGDKDKWKARDKDMVTWISHDNGWYQLRTFTICSQLLSKAYDVQACDYSPVALT